MKAADSRNIKQRRGSIPIPMRAKIKTVTEALVKIKKLCRSFIHSNHQECLHLSLVSLNLCSVAYSLPHPPSVVHWILKLIMKS